MTRLPTIRRPTSRAERHWPWLLLAALISMFLFGLVAVVATGLLAAADPVWWGRNVRGYTAVGLLLGVIAVILAITSFLYSVRKRGRQETMPLRGTMMMWLWAHVYLGVVALVAATLHGGAGLLTTTLSSGKLLYAVFALLVLSGVAWRLIYATVPGTAVRRVRNYAREDALDRAATQLVAMETLAAGKSAAFQGLKERLAAGETVADTAVRDLPREEKGSLAELRRLAASRQRALGRLRWQAHYTRLLQGWRLLHIPLALGFVVLLIGHIVVVTDWPARLFPARLNGFHPVGQCADCHGAIVEQWSASMHAHAVTSPVTIVQTNQAVAQNLADETSPDPKLLCNNCHAPAAVLLTGQKQATLPLDPPPGISQAQVDEGVNCTACHQFTAPPASALAALSLFQDGLRPGRIYYGSLADPVGNAFHQGQPLDRFDAPETTCMSCHNVELDRNGDGVPNQAGVDLVLQQTFNEFLVEYDGPQTCVTCHMPLLDPAGRVAETAVIPFQQDYEAPPRAVRSHSFVGVDYPLDMVALADPQRAEREALLRSAARFSLDRESVVVSDGRLRFAVRVDNNNLGHRLPTGFAFARQMWVEVIIRAPDGSVLFTSGVVADNTTDLCDAETMADAMATFVVGCALPDPQLVNFQQKLVTDVAQAFDGAGNPVAVQAPGGVETALQALDGGAVARVRPFDGQLLTRIAPQGDERIFFYELPLATVPESVTIDTRLRFRNLPPYFLRALAAGQTPGGGEPLLAPLIPNLQIVDMATDRATFELR